MPHQGHSAASPSAVFAALLAALVMLPTALRAETIIDQWANVKLPPAPTLKPVKLDPKTTALLMVDFLNQNCGKRPTCIASLPAVTKLRAKARAAKVPVIYTVFATATAADIMKDMTPLPDEPVVAANPDKFVNSDLGKMLKDKGIQTVIVTGTASNGAVLFTGAGAAMRDLNVIVPVDGISSSDPFVDLSTVFTFANAPTLGAKSTLTRLDMIEF